MGKITVASVFDGVTSPLLRPAGRPIKKKSPSLFPVSRLLGPAVLNKASKVLMKVDEVRQTLMMQTKPCTLRNHSSPHFVCSKSSDSPAFDFLFLYSVSVPLFICGIVVFVLEFLLFLTR